MKVPLKNKPGKGASRGGGFKMNPIFEPGTATSQNDATFKAGN
jgi:hypothetical protein